MISRMLTDISCKLHHLDLVLQVPLKTPIEDLPLARFEAIHHGSNRPYIIGITKMNELLIDEIPVGETLIVSVEDNIVRIVRLQPSLPVVSLLLIKNKIDGLVILLSIVFEFQSVLLQALEILLRLLVGGGSQSFVVFYPPGFEVVDGLAPRSEVLESEEGLHLVAVGGFDNGRHELFEEASMFEEAGPEEVDEIDDKSLYVRAICVLIGHDHQTPITETFDFIVFPTKLQS